MIRAKCEEGCRDAGKDPDDFRYILQLHLSWAPTDEEAMANAMLEWPNGGMKFPKQDIRSPLDFEQMAKLVRPEDFEGRMLISSDPEKHREQIQKYLDLGFDQIYLHNVGRNQAEWIETFGRDVLPKLTACYGRVRPMTMRFGAQLWSQHTTWPELAGRRPRRRAGRLGLGLDVGPPARDLRAVGAADPRGLDDPRRDGCR